MISFSRSAILLGVFWLSACAANPVRPASAPIDYRAGAPHSSTIAETASRTPAPKPAAKAKPPAAAPRITVDTTPPAAERPTASPAVAEARDLPPQTGVRPGGQLQQPLKSADARVVEVLPGETIGALARRMAVNRQALIDANGLKAPYALSPGARILLPAPNIHVVEPGETLYSVSRRFNVDTRSLAVMNRLERPWLVWPGDELLLPLLATADFGRQGAAVAAAGSPKQTPSGSKPASPMSGAKPLAGAADTEFAWPVAGRLLRSYGVDASGERSDGIDLAVEAGATVRAAAAGQVVYAGEGVNGAGSLLLIQHASGWVSAYGLADRLLVAEGDAVVRGQPVAAAANVGDARIHFELRLGKAPVDPLGRLPQPG